MEDEVQLAHVLKALIQRLYKHWEEETQEERRRESRDGSGGWTELKEDTP